VAEWQTTEFTADLFRINQVFREHTPDLSGKSGVDEMNRYPTKAYNQSDANNW